MRLDDERPRALLEDAIIASLLVASGSVPIVVDVAHHATLGAGSGIGVLLIGAGLRMLVGAARRRRDWEETCRHRARAR